MIEQWNQQTIVIVGVSGATKRVTTRGASSRAMAAHGSVALSDPK
jgi:hypothetical protein